MRFSFFLFLYPSALPQAGTMAWARIFPKTQRSLIFYLKTQPLDTYSNVFCCFIFALPLSVHQFRFLPTVWPGRKTWINRNEERTDIHNTLAISPLSATLDLFQSRLQFLVIHIGSAAGRMNDRARLGQQRKRKKERKNQLVWTRDSRKRTGLTGLPVGERQLFPNQKQQQKLAGKEGKNQQITRENLRYASARRSAPDGYHRRGSQGVWDAIAIGAGWLASQRMNNDKFGRSKMISWFEDATENKIRSVFRFLPHSPPYHLRRQQRL